MTTITDAHLNSKDACKWAGISSSTLRRSWNGQSQSKQISYVTDDKNIKHFDRAELERVFPEECKKAAKERALTEGFTNQSVTQGEASENDRHQEQIDDLKAQLKRALEQSEKWQDEAGDWKQQARKSHELLEKTTLLLTHDKEKAVEDAKQAEPPEPEKKGFFRRMFG